MPRRSAGVLFYRVAADVPKVLLVHPGGPFWRGKDEGAWQIPKGEIEAGEHPETAARREVQEELGYKITMNLMPLGEIRQAGAAQAVAFAGEANIEADDIVSAMIEIEWPPRSGKRIEIPEIDAARWLTISEARRLILPSQLPLLDALEALLGHGETPAPRAAGSQ